MFHVSADLGFGEAFLASRVYDEIACCPGGDFAADVSVEMELTVGPFHFDLQSSVSEIGYLD